MFGAHHTKGKHISQLTVINMTDGHKGAINAHQIKADTIFIYQK